VPQSQNSYEFWAAEITVRMDPKQKAPSVSQFEGTPARQRLDSSFAGPGRSVAALKRSRR
jgi:hypothetical protein